MISIQKTKKTQITKGVLAPLFDRLCDDAPDHSEEDPCNYVLSLEQLKKSIHRELELILNTRPTYKLNSDEGELVINNSKNSDDILMPTAFGLPDFSWYDSSKKWTIDHLARQIEQAIDRYEPRLNNVHVKIIGKVAATQGLQISLNADVIYNKTSERTHFPLTIMAR